jgi:hypothetical protein
MATATGKIIIKTNSEESFKGIKIIASSHPVNVSWKREVS